jgi:hypothetical protein
VPPAFDVQWRRETLVAKLLRTAHTDNSKKVSRHATARSGQCALCVHLAAARNNARGCVRGVRRVCTLKIASSKGQSLAPTTRTPRHCGRAASAAAARRRRAAHATRARSSSASAGDDSTRVSAHAGSSSSGGKALGWDAATGGGSGASALVVTGSMLSSSRRDCAASVLGGAAAAGVEAMEEWK